MWSQAELRAFREALGAGQVTAAPAEGQYGYCVDPFNEAALAKLVARKQRDASKGFILLVPDVAALAQVCAPLDSTAQAAIERYWQVGQAPTTLLLSPIQTLPALLSGTFSTIAVRCPQVDYVQEYLQAWGKPLVSTSLNVAGAEPAVQAVEVPTDIAALTLAEPLSGASSRIYDPLTERFLR